MNQPAFGFVVVAFCASLAVATPAAAHPHVLVDAKAEIVFDDKGEITAVRHIWQFDEAFTAFAVQGLDANNDGKLSDDELAPLAKVNVESLAEFDFFTFMTIAGKDQNFVPPTEYWLEFHNSRLTLFYTLPLKAPVAVNSGVTLEIFDPEYFVAFTMVKDHPVALDGAPAGCRTSIRLPGELDPQTAAVLGAVPVDQRVLPPDLRQAASVLANVITITCPPTSTSAATGTEVAMAPTPEGAPNPSASPALPDPASVRAVPATRPSHKVVTVADNTADSQAAVAPAGRRLNPVALAGVGLIVAGAAGIVLIVVRRRLV